jgi:hypothetical protein
LRKARGNTEIMEKVVGHHVALTTSVVQSLINRESLKNKPIKKLNIFLQVFIDSSRIIDKEDHTKCVKYGKVMVEAIQGVMEQEKELRNLKGKIMEINSFIES